MRAKVMRFSSAVFLASILAVPSGTALGAVQTGNEVTVNPLPTTGGSRTLLYPGGQYMRVVQPLLQPGEKPGAVQLHMPAKRAAARPVQTAVAAPAAAPAPAPERAAPVRPSPPKRVAAAAPAPAATPAPAPAS